MDLNGLPSDEFIQWPFLFRLGIPSMFGGFDIHVRGPRGDPDDPASVSHLLVVRRYNDDRVVIIRCPARGHYEILHQGRDSNGVYR